MTSDALHILHAGSLNSLVEHGLVPGLGDLGIEVTHRGGGSVALADGILSRQLGGGLFLSADASVNALLLGDGAAGPVTWFTTFARNSVVLAYAPSSPFAADLEAASAGGPPWYEVMQRPGFRFRRGDPDADPLAYYIVMVGQLAERHYGVPGLKQALLGEDRDPRQLAPGVSSPRNGDADAAFLYRSTASEWGLPFLTLPPEVNLGVAEQAGTYAAASYRTSDGTRTFPGRPIMFSAAVLQRSPQAGTAARAIEWLLGPEGQRLVAEYHFEPGPRLLGGMPADVPPAVQALSDGAWR